MNKEKIIKKYLKNKVKILILFLITGGALYSQNYTTVTGDNNTSNGNYSVIVGNENTNNGNDILIIGNKNKVSNSESNHLLILGDNAAVNNGSYGIFVGDSAGKTSGDYTFAFGNKAAASSTGSYVFSFGEGSGNTTSGAYNFAFGENTSQNIPRSYNFAFGENAGQNVPGSYNFAFGKNAGQNLFITDKDNNIISSASNSFYVGSSAGNGSSGSSNTAIGEGAGQNTSGSNNFAFGENAGYSVSGNNNVIFGANAGSNLSGSENYFFGSGAGQNTKGSYNFAFGLNAGQYVNRFNGITTENNGSQSVGQNNLAFGENAGSHIVGNHNIAFGENSGMYVGYDPVKHNEVDKSEHNISFGTSSGNYINGQDNFAAGQYSGSNISGDSNITIGNNSGRNIQGSDNISIGEFAGNYSLDADNNEAINPTTTIEKSNSISIGNRAFAKKDSSISIGYNSQATEKNTLALGSNSLANISDSIALGNNSETVNYDPEKLTTMGKEPYTSYNNTLNFAGGDNVIGVLSIGNTDKTRRIQNVAPGLIADTSTDAINGSQLYAVINNIKAPDITMNFYNGGKEENGNYTAVSENTPVNGLNFVFKDGLKASKETSDNKTYIVVGIDKGVIPNLSESTCKPGKDGDSAYDIWVQVQKKNGITNEDELTKAKFIESLKGPKGDPGKSYELANDINDNTNNYKAPTSLAVKKYIDRKLKEFENKISGIGALTSAISSLPQVSYDKAFGVGVGFGYQNRAGAFALGVSGQNIEKTIVYKASLGINTSKQFNIGAGINYSFGNLKNTKTPVITTESIKPLKDEFDNYKNGYKHIMDVLQNTAVQKFAKIVIDNFAVDKYNLKPEQKELIKHELSSIKGKILSIEISGFTDSYAPNKYNLDLGLDRANVVAAYLVNELHIDSNLIKEITSSGYNTIVTKLGTHNDEIKNRRVEIKIIYETNLLNQ